MVGGVRSTSPPQRRGRIPPSSLRNAFAAGLARAAEPVEAEAARVARAADVLQPEPEGDADERVGREAAVRGAQEARLPARLDTPSGFVPGLLADGARALARRLRAPAHLGHPDRLGRVAVVGHHRVDLAVGRERVAADAPALVAVEASGSVGQARGVGVHADRVERAPGAVGVEGREEVHVVADHPAGHHDVGRLGRLDRRVGRAQQRRVGRRVGAAQPELGAVGLVPQLPRVDARHRAGDPAHEAAERRRVRRRRDPAAAARGPRGRAMDDDEHLDPARLERRDAPVHALDQMLVELPRRRLHVLPERPHAHPVGAERARRRGQRLGVAERLVDAGLDRAGGVAPVSAIASAAAPARRERRTIPPRYRHSPRSG